MTTNPGHFIVRVLGASSQALYRFDGDEARDLRASNERGQLDRGEPLRRLRAMIARDAPVASDSAMGENDVDFELVDPAQLRGWLSRRVLERRSARE
ncbi:MAG: hypothetical protein EPO26_08825 [Chloroflexota bacterium]|nr:MAG: hypothetical protein EPO26_08825 [Chloroflexota bacterium]